jgi:fructan beta-fructosidase
MKMILKSINIMRKTGILLAGIFLFTACSNSGENKADNKLVPVGEPFRPAYHFSPPKNWCNDPNGMVWYAGEYHLFYQHNPQGTKWGNMSWGHAVSEDLIHWEHLPVALYPDAQGDIFSGSAVVDENNTAGFQTGEEKTLLAFYTYNKDGVGQSQALAYSTDKGRNWTKYAKNPVLRHRSGAPDFRDPKVFWYARENKWVMVLAVGAVIEIYSSPNAKEWTYESAFGSGYGNHDGIWECPDLFQIGEKWILIVNNSRNGENSGSATQYFVGEFDGKTFISESPAGGQSANWLDYGKEHYAFVTWSNAPENRKIGIAWMNNWEYANELPTHNFRGAMSVPRELTLVENGDSYLLKNYPVEEIESLRGDEKKFDGLELSDNRTIKKDVPPGGVYELLMDIEKRSAQKMGFTLKNSKDEKVTVTFDFQQNKFSVDRTKSGITNFSDKFPATTTAPIIAKNKYQLRVLVDRSSIECFLDGGEVSMTNLVFPNEPYSTIEFFGGNGEPKIDNVKIIKLQ